MSNPVTLAVHELEALLEKAKAAAEHIIHPAVEAPSPAAPTVEVEPAVPTPAPAPAVTPAPVKVVNARPTGVRIAGQNYAKDGLTQEWHQR